MLSDWKRKKDERDLSAEVLGPMAGEIRLGIPAPEVLGHMRLPEGVVCPTTSVPGHSDGRDVPIRPHMPEIFGLMALRKSRCGLAPTALVLLRDVRLVEVPLGGELVHPGFDDVADADDRREAAVDDDRQVADAVVRHEGADLGPVSYTHLRAP